MWFDSWSDLVRVLLVGTAAYVGLVIVLRVSGKRTLAKLNAFDLIVTVALGSTLATILLSSDVSWVEGITALVLLAALQFVAAFLSSRWETARKLLTATPTLIVDNGTIIDDAIASQRISHAQVRQAARSSGMGSVALVGAMVVETDGSLSVISTEQLGDRTALSDVSGVIEES